MEQNEAHPHSKEHQHHQHRGLGTSLTHWLTQRERNVKSGTTGLTLEMDEERGWEQKCVSLCCPVFFLAEVLLEQPGATVRGRSRTTWLNAAFP